MSEAQENTNTATGPAAAVPAENTQLASPATENSTSIKDETLDRRTLFVRSVPESATSDELSEYFSQFVPVKHAVIVNDDQQKSRGFGFVSFTEDEDTLTALVEAKKHKFQGRFLRVDIAKRRERKAAKNAKNDGAEPESTKPKIAREPVEKRKARLIVRNLPWTCKSPETLKKLFLRFGAVHDAYIPTKKGGLMRGFAFVIMKKNVAAERAVKESVGLKIDGREVAVDLAVEKSQWEKVQETEPKTTARERKSKDSELKAPKTEKDDDEDDDEDLDEDGEADEDFDKLNEINSDAEVPESGEDLDEEMDSDEEEEEDRPKQNKQEAFSVFVRNIPYDADADSLKEHFAQFGPVKYALPVMDRATGLAKGSAFVAFKNAEAYELCLADAPAVSATSMLISDDVAPEYVYQGRILSIASTVDRSSASRLAERNSEKRSQALGKDTGDKDKRNLYLLNEGRITENSKLAERISKADMEIREKSYKMRVQQLNKNPSLHLSLTRLAVRNLPRAMTSKALKALGRKAVVEFATEVKNNQRQPLSKEEVNRSIKYKQDMDGDKPAEDEKEKKNNKKLGVVRQSKIIMEVKGSGEAGRSRGYGFIEFRDHKTALMGLRWLNAHEVTVAEITESMSEEEKKVADLEGINKRKLIVEFAVENAKVVKRRKELVMVSRHNKRKRDDDGDRTDKGDKASKKPKKGKGPSRKGNMNKGPKPAPSEEPTKPSGESIAENVKHIIARKRKGKKGKN
ncbi:putative nucleolar protein Nop4 [Metschnikowia bicuspidata var. bicuspidata NRRL YB-4993]|uniref:Putative nucleolar protein Nop4 n=1 Tax=Metschnikowia bicuspidata var. bicuspidata NRRL YB-4993 TaxID=869754 RepID=A0A1A0HDG5_9ASCO|nr:putative nucleolar protein Nop4 [Metschnikowia bicuspidata var. bicuspidata NRRL YB-4993]OBA21937.1 putative nucleolar protein Nop4 [Metschnikowia bicuspidata var. bicuspidata NRRL YB-4993]